MITLRLTSSSLAGTTRKLVAVGTPRLASMFDDDHGARASDRIPDLADGAGGTARVLPPREPPQGRARASGPEQASVQASAP